MRCHYEVLGLPINASLDDIKKAYRKCALQWHPDKHINDKDKEEANKRFLEIQDAYETLSNDQERAWYDSHREIIINGGVPGEADSTNFLFNIYPFFSSSCFKGFGDDEKGFYSIYRDMFARIAEEDRSYYEEETEIPEFGRSDSDYEEVVAPFYAFWLNYCSPRSFVWVEKHDTREASDRQVRRIMEKENKKARDKAKKERNEEIRKITDFVRKKDKRVEQYKKLAEERALLAQKKAQEKKEADRLKRAEQMKAYVEPEWSQINNRLETFELEDEDIASDGENSNENQTQEVDEDREDNDDFDDNLFCVACNKAFKSSKSYENHGKSKKHKENVELLKKHMKEEDEHLFASLNKNESAQEPEQTKQKLSKKQKKKKRQNKQEKEDDEEEEDEENEHNDEQPILDAISENSKNENDQANMTDKQERKTSHSSAKPLDEQIQLICTVCQEEFSSRNKLFDHIKTEGHAAPKLEKPLSHNAIKKNKRLAKATKK